MGTSQASKAVTHQHIVQVASKRFRERGLEGIGLADIMKEAGVAIGGFYKHFGSKDELVCEALQVAFSDFNVIGQSPSLAKDIEKYLSVEHRDSAETGCATGALLGDLVHASPRVREVYTSQVMKSLLAITSRLNERNHEKARADALLLMSALLGAINLSRALDEPALAREFLIVVRARLAEILSPVTRASGQATKKKVQKGHLQQRSRRAKAGAEAG